MFRRSKIIMFILLGLFSLPILSAQLPAQAANNLALAQRNTRSLKSYLFAGLGIATLSGLTYFASKDYASIKTIEDKYKSPKNIQDADRNRERELKIRFTTWKLQDYPTHVAIRERSSDFLRSIESHFTILNNQEKLDLIRQEQNELESDIAYLERNFVTYFNFPGFLPFIGGEHGLKKYYETLKPKNDGEGFWTREQLAHIETKIKEMSKNRWWHFFTYKWNYSKAARVWWRLKKYQMRLNVIEDLIAQVNANLTYAPVQQRSDRVQDLSVHSNSRHIGRVDVLPPAYQDAVR